MIFRVTVEQEWIIDAASEEMMIETLEALIPSEDRPNATINYEQIDIKEGGE